jgi:ankyrin repeat protein
MPPWQTAGPQLMLAAVQAHAPVAQALLDGAADLAAALSDGGKALMLAKQHGLRPRCKSCRP